MKTKRGVKMPARSTKGSAGYDFHAPKDIVIKAGEWTEFGTGVFLDGTERAMMTMRRHNPLTGFDEIVEYEVENWVLMLYPRSGLGFKHKVRLANSTGVIDQTYRDEIRCKMTADEDIVIPKGTAYMQGVLTPYLTFSDEEAPTEERRGGFGSTDRKKP